MYLFDKLLKETRKEKQGKGRFGEYRGIYMLLCSGNEKNFLFGLLLVLLLLLRVRPPSCSNWMEFLL